MDPLPIGQLKETTPEGCSKYALIIPKVRHHYNGLLQYQIPAGASGNRQEVVDVSLDLIHNALSTALDDCKRLQNRGMPYTGILTMDEKIQFIEGEVAALTPEELEKKWFSDLKTALEGSVSRVFF